MDSVIVPESEIREEAYRQLAHLFMYGADIGSYGGWTVLGRVNPHGAMTGSCDFIAVGPRKSHSIGCMEVYGGMCGPDIVQEVAKALAEGQRSFDRFSSFTIKLNDRDKDKAPRLPTEHESILTAFCDCIRVTAWSVWAEDVENYMSRSSGRAGAGWLARHWPWAAVMAPSGIYNLDKVADWITGPDEGKVSRHLLAALKTLEGQVARQPEWMLSAMQALNAMPPEWAVEESYEEAQEEWDAALYILGITGLISKATGRTVSRIVGKFPGSWTEYARLLGVRSGGGDHRLALENCTHMMDHFESQVAKPLLWREGKRKRDANWLTATPWLEKSAIRDATLKLLAGSRSLPGLCEMSARWNVSVTAIAEKELRLTDADDTWQAIMPTKDITLASGAVMRVRQLSRFSDFLDEGREMGHCIASYARQAYDNIGSVFLSVSEVTPVARRVSTVELVVALKGEDDKHRIRQHFGARNSPPSLDAMAAVIDYLESIPPEIDPGSRDLIGKYRYPGLYDPDAKGSVETMRDAWSFQLTKEQMAMPLDDLVKPYLEALVPKEGTQDFILHFLDSMMEDED